MSILIKGMEIPKEGGVIAIYKLKGEYYASVHGTELCPIVEVVHCKDCKYLHRTVCPYGISKTPHGNDYCSYGDRKDDKD